MGIMEVKLMLNESAGGNKYRVRIIQAGQGSSGFYPAAVLEEFGATAFPKGTHCFVGHSITGSPDRTAEHIVGVLDSDAEYVAEDESLYAVVRFTSRGMKIVEELKDDVGMSISAQGTKSEEGIIESIEFSPNNSVDIVPRAGANGKILDLTESYATIIRENTVPEKTAADERKKMTEEEIQALAVKITESFAPIFAEIREALAPVEAEVVEAVEPDLVAATEAAHAAGLPATQRESVRVDVAAGVSLEEAITKQKGLRDEILAEAATDSAGGRLLGDSKPVDLKIDWK